MKRIIVLSQSKVVRISSSMLDRATITNPSGKSSKDDLGGTARSKRCLSVKA